MKILRSGVAIAVTFILFVNLVTAQGILQVATKKIEKTIGAPAIRTLYIAAEKADVEIISWDKSDISIVMELSARHPERNIAAQDLSKLQYIAERNGKDFYLRNYVLLKDSETRPVSNLKAKYVIRLPHVCSVDLKNSFGTIKLRGLTNKLNLKADFCTTDVAGLSGKSNLQTSFGVLNGNALAGTLSFSGDHTSILLTQIAGAVRIEALYGNVEISPTTALTSLSVKSKNSDVALRPGNWKHFDYSINGAYTAVKLPNGFKWKKNTHDFKEAYFSNNQITRIRINAEFGQVTVR